ncbi:MAG TPA: monomeric [FeFe] hydrogenase [Tenuifilaceae bacterium]|nr:monomeric [FeFe] hydrogenase [Tenuifilaceae bacterium]
MAVTNNAMLIRRDLLTHFIKLLIEDNLADVDRIPLEMRPKNESSIRCCIYKDRAVLKYKLMGMLGFSSRDEVDELIPLSDYARKAFNGEVQSDKILTVVDEACSSCLKINYMVSNMCRGCVGRPCMVNCPKEAIKIVDGKAKIDHNICVNCGQCMKVCPFHAIVYIPIPCEEACPVNAISRDEDGVEYIDSSKCIYCGKCLSACPFGAIVEKSHLVDIFRTKKSGKPLVALIAPALAGQFGGDLGRIIHSFKMLGFSQVYEVAYGAEETARLEAEELKESLNAGEKFLTSSCCPSYTMLVDKHLQELKPFVSKTATPMHYSAVKARELFPDACTVFVSPCSAKKREAMDDANVDYVLSFEEYGAWLVAAGIDLNNIESETISEPPIAEAREFAISGGVTNALRVALNSSNLNDTQVNGIDKTSIRLLKSFVKNPEANYVEVMCCEGGCVGGCNVITNPKVATRQIKNGKK